MINHKVFVEIERTDDEGNRLDVTFLDMDTPTYSHVSLYYRLIYGEDQLIYVCLTHLHKRNYVEGFVINFVGEESTIVKNIDHCLRDGYVLGHSDSFVTLDVCNGMVSVTPRLHLAY